ncbi:hypothetical protein SAMN05216559_0237 [Halomicrobium zhouii]|uniref:Uncharacterized protein n=1 Tax=Halomicrobium zhouii TaxID=767519 RepID=A0A1I6K5Q0_9EURY|nr:hypothetical protein [Halomicrobium zhouii]SFR86571.1 hypothetical protein SAMN05216559_0237 [Halomicrobium zhouii]
MVDIDSETLFNGAAALVATIAVLMFVTSMDFEYSPVTKVALVAAFLGGVFAITQRSDDYQLILLGYAVVVTSVLALFFDLTGTFEVDTEPTVLGLLVLAGLLFGLRSRLDDESHFVSGRLATYAFGALVALAVVVLTVDVVTGGLAYELQHDATVEVDGADRQPIELGSVTATNPTPLPERVEVPRYEACPAGNWSAYAPPSPQGEPEREVHVNLYVDDGYNEHVLGFGSKTYPATLRIDGANLTGERFPVERTDECPTADDGEPYVAMFEASDDDRYYGYAL